MVYYMQTQNKRGYELVQFVQAHKLIKQDSSSSRDFKFIYKQKNKFHAALLKEIDNKKAVVESISGQFVKEKSRHKSSSQRLIPRNIWINLQAKV